MPTSDHVHDVSCSFGNPQCPAFMESADDGCSPECVENHDHRASLLTKSEEAVSFGVAGLILLAGALIMSLALPWVAVLMGTVAGAMMTTAVVLGEWRKRPWD